MVLLDILSDILYLFYPEYCIACDEKAPAKGHNFCIHCLFHIPYTDHFESTDNELALHFYGRQVVSSAAALFYMQKDGIVHRLIYNLKYRNQREIGKVLGQNFGRKVLLTDIHHSIDCVVAVPLHYKRRLSRGYNQSEIFARGIAEILNVPIVTSVLWKQKASKSQTGMNRSKRINNVQGTFSIRNSQVLKNKHILLVDDVVTTGATLEACIMLLIEIKGIKISVGAIALAR